jgi:hypothetical protein
MQGMQQEDHRSQLGRLRPAGQHRLLPRVRLIPLAHVERRIHAPLLHLFSRHYDRMVAAKGNSVSFSSSVVKHPSGISKT